MYEKYIGWLNYNEIFNSVCSHMRPTYSKNFKMLYNVSKQATVLTLNTSASHTIIVVLLEENIHNFILYTHILFHNDCSLKAKQTI